MDRKPPPYMWFQTSTVNPQYQPKPPTFPPPAKPYLSPPPAPSPEMRYTISITAGATPSTQRTWHIPPTLLQAHCTRALKTATATALTLPPNIPTSTFQNFVDYMHSSIYSLNKNALDYHPIRSHASAWILGDFLGAGPFRDTAFRMLYDVFEPGARSSAGAQIGGGGGGDAAGGIWKSVISAADVEYVCDNTSAGSLLRTLFFDSVVSHATQFEVLNFTSFGTDALGSGTSWTAVNKTREDKRQQRENEIWMEVGERNPDFRERVESSARVADRVRGKMLRGVEEYLEMSGGGSTGKGKEKEAVLQSVEDEVDLEPKPPKLGKSEQKWGKLKKVKPFSSLRKARKSDESAIADENEEKDADVGTGFGGKGSRRERRSSSSPQEETMTDMLSRSPGRSGSSASGSSSQESRETESVFYEADDDEDYMMIDDA
ncbi:hypothetical protein CC80DRAFT_533122 [Byssothecium circinans]|uniref:BTB domain-containing protein n=1 Tax=Byssothecium circinans TaxID=147558 RepID=A0A6A5UA74_9PLEO|nr:hypothetical protein CC80DRAFT_533122 [Byssothecium circinans]